MGRGRGGEERITASQTCQGETNCQQSHSLLLHHQSLSETVGAIAAKSLTAELKNQTRGNPQIVLGGLEIIIVYIINLEDADG
jgi:hypothetical protein